jgi:uncharacterized protein YndB with AHSA1/START domain
MSHDVRVITTVAADPALAFRIFTEETDLWWRRGPRWRFTRSPRSVLRFEPGVGGRLVEIDPDEEGAGWIVGAVEVWDPGARLRFSWRLPNFAPEESTAVEVRFEAVGEQTRVTLEHFGLRALPPGHPARHGEAERDYLGRVGRWWGALLLSAGQVALQRSGR